MNVSAGNVSRAYDDADWLRRTRTSAIGRRVDLDAVYVDELARKCRERTEGRRRVEQRSCQRQTTVGSTVHDGRVKTKTLSSFGSGRWRWAAVGG